MSRTMKHFEKELSIMKNNLKKGDKLVISEYEDYIKYIIEIFNGQGHSGGSAPLYAEVLSKTIKNALLCKPLSPIIGDNSEWSNSISNDDTFQNKRCSALFKKGKDGNPYYLDAIVFRGENGSCFTGNGIKRKNGSTIASRQFVKLPFTPKTFYVDVVETEWHKDKDTGGLTKKAGGGWWTYVLKDESQIDEVAAYYDMPISPND